MKDVRRIAVAGVLTATALATTPARAATIGTIPGGSNELIHLFLGVSRGIEGWYGADLYLTGPAAQYFGAEAGYTNSFTYGGCGSTHRGGYTFVQRGTGGLGADDIVGGCSTGAQPAGLMNFGFLINGSTGPRNGLNPSSVSPLPNFFVTVDNNYVFDTLANGSTASSGQSLFLFLDDGGTGTEADYDDLVIRLIVQGATFQVPEPTSLALLGLGLLGAAAAARKNKL